MSAKYLVLMLCNSPAIQPIATQSGVNDFVNLNLQGYTPVMQFPLMWFPLMRFQLTRVPVMQFFANLDALRLTCNSADCNAQWGQRLYESVFTGGPLLMWLPLMRIPLTQFLDTLRVSGRFKSLTRRGFFSSPKTESLYIFVTVFLTCEAPEMEVWRLFSNFFTANILFWEHLGVIFFRPRSQSFL